MPLGTGWHDYSKALQHAIGQLDTYRPDVLIVSLGVDTYKDDPVGGFALESEDYLRIGEIIAQAGVPTHFILEGGYAMAALGLNVGNVVTGFEA
jgi:acetoin utilization deacetylase AcuC-like enzyme